VPEGRRKDHRGTGDRGEHVRFAAYLDRASEGWAQTMAQATAAGTNTEAIEILATAGRAKRVRNAARLGSNRHSEN
jgi:hypothetical protein